MSSPILYTIKKGDTLSSIAKEKGIKNWKDLQVYHNSNCPLNEQIGTSLKENHILYTPPQDVINEMNGTTKKNSQPESQKKEEKPQEDKPKEEKKDEKNEDSKSEHDGKYFVVHGAKCVCDMSEVKDQKAVLQVTSHQKMIYNDQSGKFAATEEDKQFNPPSATFGKCKLQPSSSGYLPCALAPAPKWDKPYDKTTVMGKKVLTEISQLKCTVGGIIKIKEHGQTDSVTTAHAQNTNPAEMAHANPAVKKPIAKAEYPLVDFITIESVENRTQFKPVKSTENKKEVEKIYVRPDENCSFTANVNKGNKSLTSWVVYDGFEGKSDKKAFTKEQIGTSFSNSFPTVGNFRVEGYGKPKTKEFENGKYDKNDPSCSIDVIVAINKLVDDQLELFGQDFSAKIKEEIRLRKDFPAAFKAKFLIPPTQDELSRLEMFVTDEAGNRLSDYTQEGKILNFTPTNADAVYNFHAVYKDDEGNEWKQSFKGKTLTKNYVVSISHTDQVVREFSPVGFEVKQMKIGSLITADSDLTEGEIQDIKWNLNGVYQNSGRVLNISRGLPLGSYIVEAYCSMANAFGTKAKKEEDDWHFEVKRNDVVEIQTSDVLKVGKKVTFTASGFVFKDLLPNEKVNWTLNQYTLADSKTMTTTFRSAGSTTVSAKINTEKGITKTFNVVQPILENVMFTDSQGIQIEKSAWGNKVNIWLKEKYLTGEKLKISLVVGTTPVYYFPEKVYDGELIELHLNDDIRKYAKNEPTLKVVVNATELDFPNEGKPLGTLEVGFAREVYSGIIGSEDGRQKHSPVDYDMMSWFYGKSRGIKETEKVTIEIWEDNLLIDEKLLSGEASPDKSGAIKFKIDWGKIPKGKQDSFKNVYVKVLDNNHDKAVLYDGDSLFFKNYTPLIAKSTVNNLSGYSSAAIVGSTSVNIASIDNKFGVCEYEARVRAFLRMLRIGEGTEGENGYKKLFAGEDFTAAPHNKNMSKHPQIIISKSGYSSSATGAYQIKGDVYDELIKRYGENYDINGFDQEKQDKLCITILKHNYLTKRPSTFFNPKKDNGQINTEKKEQRKIFENAYGDILQLIIDGNLEKATLIASLCWASLPNAPYGQPTHLKTFADVKAKYEELLKEELEGKSKELHLKKGFLKEFGYANCVPFNATDGIVTYRIYTDGIIEKHIPKRIKSGFENKYRYIYHGSKNVQNEICTIEWHETIEKLKGVRYNSIPNHSKVIEDNNVSEGQTSRRVKYENDDIAEYGINKGEHFWNLYKCADNKPKIEVIRMPDSLNYQKNGIMIAYTFSNTQRRYTSPGAMAGFIGALAECGYSDIQTTGSCFKEGSCFPSVKHINGKSIDTLYIDEERQKKIIKAMAKFKFNDQISGTDSQHSYDGTSHDAKHNDHLHSGFNESAVLIVKEK